MRLHDLKDALVREIFRMDQNGNFFINYKFPRQSGATTTLLRTAAQLARGKRNVLVVFWSYKHGQDRFRKEEIKDLELVRIESLVHTLMGKKFIDEETIVLIDNLQYSKMKDEDLRMLKELTIHRSGKLKIMAIDTI
uniref:Uncharacterized protein n=1 Tax=Ochrobactrum phage ORM_20 TaxID=2985243 RepID=A0A9N6WS88_9VIRU|nr:hypothetical protein ORM20_00237 [Ochrobactrum phage ORM_20]